MENRKGKVEDLMPGGQFFEGESAPELTIEAIREVIATQLDNGFFRTRAGYVSFSAGFDRDDRLMLTMTHWKSFNCAEDDEIRRVHIELGELRP